MTCQQLCILEVFHLGKRTFFNDFSSNKKLFNLYCSYQICRRATAAFVSPRWTHSVSGKTVIFSIHQPSSEVFASFHKLMLLSAGRTVYFGNANSSVEYFANLGFKCPKFTNPGDFIVSLISTDFARRQSSAISQRLIIENYHESEQHETIIESIENCKVETWDVVNSHHKRSYQKRSSFMMQFSYLLYRNCRNTALNAKIFRARLFSYSMFAFLYSFLFSTAGRGQIPDFAITALFFTIMYNFGLQTMSALPFFLHLRPVFVRERCNGMYGVLPFHMANVVGTIPVLVVCSLSATGIFHLWIGLYGNYFWFWFTTFWLMLCSESVMHILSAITRQYGVAFSIAAFYVIFYICTAGYIVPKKQLAYIFKTSSYTSYFQYAFQNFVFNEFRHDPKGLYLLKSYSAAEVNLGMNVLVMSGFVAALQLIFFLLLYFIHDGRQ